MRNRTVLTKFSPSCSLLLYGELALAERVDGGVGFKTVIVCVLHVHWARPRVRLVDHGDGVAVVRGADEQRRGVLFKELGEVRLQARRGDDEREVCHEALGPAEGG